MLYGSLQDQYEEFFITQASESDVSSSTVADVPSGDDLDVGGVTGKQLSLITASTFRSFHYYTVSQKKNWATIHLFITLTNVGRLSKFFH